MWEAGEPPQESRGRGNRAGPTPAPSTGAPGWRLRRICPIAGPWRTWGGSCRDLLRGSALPGFLDRSGLLTRPCQSRPWLASKPLGQRWGQPISPAEVGRQLRHQPQGSSTPSSSYVPCSCSRRRRGTLTTPRRRSGLRWSWTRLSFCSGSRPVLDGRPIRGS